MGWDFETDPAFQEQLDWVDDFVRAEVEALDYVVANPYDLRDPVRQELIPPLQARVRERGLWATHLGPELGGPGYGQVKLALLNEILGRSWTAPIVFGCQAPDSGNAEILAHYGTAEHKRRYLAPLLANEMVSCFSMTEPHGGSDPTVFTTTAVLDGDEWVINGEKWFSSNARYAAFLIVMAVTEPGAAPYRRSSMFIVPADAPGVEIVRHVGLALEPEGDGDHAYIRYTDVRVPAENLLGDRGGAFVVAQTRLGGGRIHHAMRTVGLVRRMFDMMCERAVSRVTKGERLADKQLVQEMVADSWVEMEQFRLLTLRTAWKIDQLQDYKQVRGDIAAIKAAMPKVLHDVSARALQVHGSLGLTNEMPFVEAVVQAFHLGLADGPTEVHKVTLAREVLAHYQPSPGLFPTQHTSALRRQARARYADVLARHGQGAG
jgi:acyl-CoA dehydrogenase